MAEEVKPDTIKKTQTALNKYIKKPPLTDKLLKKPPFRFLHDIVTSVIRDTGFLEGVFTSAELVADNVKDRDSKVKFLTKLINAVKQATGTPIKAKPNKIVAGLEVDKTHELLQSIAKGISVKNNAKKTTATTQKDKKTTKDDADINEKKGEKKDGREKGKLKVGSPAASIEKQSSLEEKQDVLENGESGRRGSGGKTTENGEVGEGVNGVVDRKSGLRREGSVSRSREGEEEQREGSGRKSRKRESSAENGEGGEGQREGERRSGRRRESSAARTAENGEVGEEGERRSGRRRESSAAKVTENGELGEEQKEVERRSGRRRESSAARVTENGEGGEEQREGERRSGRRRESSAARAREDGEEPKGEGDRRSGRRRERTSGGREEAAAPATDQAEPRLMAGEPSPMVSGSAAVRRRGSLRKGPSGEDKEEVDPAQKRPQTKRASSRSSRGPLKAFGEEKGMSVELKEEEGTQQGPATLGSAQDGPAPRPPSASERPRTARRAPPTARPPSARPPSARPPSARLGAPKTRDRGEVPNDINKDEVENEIKEVLVITENEKEEEDKEEMVVVENPSLQLNEVENIRDDASVMEGVLVDSILESQSELEKRKTSKASLDIESGSRERRAAAWERECAKLREGVQSLTRAAGPLGKLFDFLQEDVDLASRELATWRKAAASFSQQLATEQRLTEEALSRPRKKLSELEAQIEEQHMAIRSLKSSVLANDKKIQTHIARFPAR